MQEDTTLPVSALLSFILAVFVLFMIPKAYMAYGSGEVTFKVAVARDIALALNVMCSYPSDFETTYNLNLENYIVEIADKTVKISSKSSAHISNNVVIGSDLTAASYPFFCDKAITARLDGPKKVTFIQKNTELTIQA
jgi:hypothetical protein